MLKKTIRARLRNQEIKNRSLLKNSARHALPGHRLRWWLFATALAPFQMGQHIPQMANDVTEIKNQRHPQQRQQDKYSY